MVGYAFVRKYNQLTTGDVGEDSGVNEEVGRENV